MSFSPVPTVTVPRGTTVAEAVHEASASPSEGHGPLSERQSCALLNAGEAFEQLAQHHGKPVDEFTISIPSLADSPRFASPVTNFSIRVLHAGASAAVVVPGLLDTQTLGASFGNSTYFGPPRASCSHP